jgi:hypothetical protein
MKKTPAELSWRKAIEKVLAEAGCAMHYKEIAEKIVEDGFRENVGATPAASVNVAVMSSINKDADKSPFQKVGRGEYILRNTAERSQTKSPKGASKLAPIQGVEEQYAVVSSFGMYWRRDLVEWCSSVDILGMEQIGAEPVNFNKQLGIYLLYDGREVIYVGRSTDRPLGRRLYEHTLDRLATRWDRFSWFGLRPVSDKGDLGELPVSFESNLVIPALEAILIEALEPRQNRKRGDDLAAVEYLQTEDPKLEKKKSKALINDMMEKAGLV